MSTGQTLIRKRDKIALILDGAIGELSEADRKYFEEIATTIKNQIQEEEICHVCGRKLSSPSSKLKGYGPECQIVAESQRTGKIPPFVVGLTGFATSGKDTAALGLIEQLGFKKLSFADPLRRDIQVLDCIVAFDEDMDPIRVSDCFEIYGYNESKERWPEFRRLLQVYGTEVHRALDDDYWINRTVGHIISDGTPGYVFTDARFPNERTGVPYDAFYRISRPGTEAINGHESEAHIKNMSVDIEILNDSTEEDLQRSIVALVRSAMDAR
jgi:hypothetical protein